MSDAQTFPDFDNNFDDQWHRAGLLSQAASDPSADLSIGLSDLTPGCLVTPNLPSNASAFTEGLGLCLAGLDGRAGREPYRTPSFSNVQRLLQLSCTPIDQSQALVQSVCDSSPLRIQVPPSGSMASLELTPPLSTSGLQHSSPSTIGSGSLPGSTHFLTMSLSDDVPVPGYQEKSEDWEVALSAEQVERHAPNPVAAGQGSIPGSVAAAPHMAPMPSVLAPAPAPATYVQHDGTSQLVATPEWLLEGVPSSRRGRSQTETTARPVHQVEHPYTAFNAGPSSAVQQRALSHDGTAIDARANRFSSTQPHGYYNVDAHSQAVPFSAPAHQANFEHLPSWPQQEVYERSFSASVHPTIQADAAQYASGLAGRIGSQSFQSSRGSSGPLGIPDGYVANFVPHGAPQQGSPPLVKSLSLPNVGGAMVSHGAGSMSPSVGPAPPAEYALAQQQQADYLQAIRMQTGAYRQPQTQAYLPASRQQAGAAFAQGSQPAAMPPHHHGHQHGPASMAYYAATSNAMPTYARAAPVVHHHQHMPHAEGYGQYSSDMVPSGSTTYTSQAPSPPFVNVDGSGHHAPTGRTLMACGHCKRRKLKCDGGSPCSSCRAKNQVCEYPKDIKRRGKAKKTLLREAEEAAAKLRAEQAIAMGYHSSLGSASGLYENLSAYRLSPSSSGSKRSREEDESEWDASLSGQYEQASNDTAAYANRAPGKGTSLASRKKQRTQDNIIPR
ncbi:4-DEOXY-L-THREO-5-HEXOSULOSE-URONATE KETOL-ISOMERASE-RELATED [Ceraceosorus bombacis]|uniref:4-DEOXY-L-THREO-5-HEXOSULOSE-URONATE KETOL-ISOMERASE-RELATED n=1 Tax=Ceraceosorus bombacis TaxID=401625 RepID=A0A0P1BQZ8_9BASI|nr:4-DEOXY-L-THREO-5-HEXOSULOSE-URONATE KETOL-ISOMERASE-RELATED [Ceraceosorus bombacis]